MRQIEEIERLLKEWGPLDQLASLLQQGEGTDFETVNFFQTSYMRWLQEGYALLPDYYKPQFWKPYEGDVSAGLGGEQLVVGIKTFLTDPLKRYFPLNLMAFFKREEPTSEIRWSHPYYWYFEPKFKEQRRVLIESLEWFGAQAKMQKYSEVPSPKLDSLSLHPKIVKVAAGRFQAGQYDDAVAYSILAVNEAVREKSGSAAADGTALMQHAFSTKNPLLRLSERDDEQRAYMELFAAAWSALRNPRAHSTRTRTDAHAAIELLGFASALMRLVDETVVVNDS
jgi:uncharacterized protein (TIGR02391 family)